jgi:RimJ/RimL family protein N-acetyltransferase
MHAALLQSERIILRPLQRSDTHWLIELATDPEVRETTLQPVSPRWWASIEAFAAVRTDQSRWVIEDRNLGIAVGWISISRPPLEPAPYPSVGFEIRRQYWNSGYATEALVCLSKHLFRAEGLEFLSGLVFVKNEASLRVFLKAGFENLGACICSGHPCYLFQLASPVKGDTQAAEALHL